MFALINASAYQATINSYFPRFADGDVEIHLSENPEDVCVLHSFVLALHSPFMKASLSDRWSKKEGGKVRWIYHLATDSEGSIGILVKRVSLYPVTVSTI